MDQQGYILQDSDVIIQEDHYTPQENPNQSGMMTREEYEEALANSKPTESILEWFDRSVESELEKHRLQAGDLRGKTISLSQGLAHPSVLQGTGSGVEIMSGLHASPDTELSNAVEKLAQAEAIMEFEGAVRAAEEAAQHAPPDRAEEAAAAGARGYQAELTGVVRDQFSGDGERPIEVIGYVGITKPSKPLKSKPINANF